MKWLRLNLILLVCLSMTFIPEGLGDDGVNNEKRSRVSGSPSTQLWSIRMQAGISAYEKKHSADAQKFLKRALDTAKAINDSGKISKSSQLLLLACLQNRNYSDAEAYAREELTRLVKDNRSCHEQVPILNGLGEACIGQTKLQDAEKFLTQALNCERASNYENVRDLAMTVHLLGGKIFERQSRYEKAEELFEVLVKERERNSLGPASVELADDCHMLAIVYFRERKFTDAEIFLKRAITIYQTHPGHRSEFISGLETYVALLRALKREKDASEIEHQIELQSKGPLLRHGDDVILH